MSEHNEIQSPDGMITPWKRNTVIGWMDDIGGVRSRFWVRYTDTRCIYHWLHPETLQWVREPGQVKMPTFKTQEDAAEAMLHAPVPKDHT